MALTPSRCRVGLVFVVFGCLAGPAVLAQSNEEVSAQILANRDPCRAEVSRFEQAIGFVRQHQGNKAAAELKEKLLPAKVESEILMKDGYCGLAKHLKDRKLSR